MRRQETLFRFSLSISPLILTIISHFTSRSSLHLTIPDLTFTPRALLYSSDGLGRLLPILFSPWSVAESVPIAISRFGQCVVFGLLPTVTTSNSSSSSTLTTLIRIIIVTYLLNVLTLLTRTLVGFILTRSVGWMYPEWFYHWALYEESSGFGAGLVVYLAVVMVGDGGGVGGNSKDSGSDTERTGTLPSSPSTTSSLPSTSLFYLLQPRTSTPGTPITTTTATIVIGTLFFWLEDRPWTYFSALIVIVCGWTLRIGVGVWRLAVGSGLGGTARIGAGERERRTKGFEGRRMGEEEEGSAFIQRDMDTNVEMDLDLQEKAPTSTDARAGVKSSSTSGSIPTSISTRLLPWKRYLILLGTSFLNAVIYHHLLVTHHPPHSQYLPLPTPSSHPSSTTKGPTRPLLEILILSYPRPPSTEVSERLLTATLDTFVPHTKKGWVGISVFTHSRDHAAMERVREAYSNENHYGLDDPGASSSNHKNASEVEVDVTFYVDEDDHPDDDQGHYLHLSEAFRWISHRSELHNGEKMGPEWIMLVEDDFPVCPGGWGAIETVVNKLERSRRRGVVRSGFVGTGGSGLIIHHTYLPLLIRILRDHSALDTPFPSPVHRFAPDQIVQSCLIGAPGSMCERRARFTNHNNLHPHVDYDSDANDEDGEETGMIITSRLVLDHIGGMATTTEGKRLNSDRWRCGWRHPFHGFDGVEVVVVD